MSLSPADLKQLQAAKNLLENPGLTAQLTSLWARRSNTA